MVRCKDCPGHPALLRKDPDWAGKLGHSVGPRTGAASSARDACSLELRRVGAVLRLGLMLFR